VGLIVLAAADSLMSPELHRNARENKARVTKTNHNGIKNRNTYHEFFLRCSERGFVVSAGQSCGLISQAAAFVSVFLQRSQRFDRLVKFLLE